MSYAFFDVDDTLVRLKSMFDFFPFWCELRETPQKLAQFRTVFEQAFAEGRPREDLNRLYYQFFAGESEERLMAAGRLWVTRRFGEQGLAQELIFPDVLARLRAHRACGVAPILVSGSMPALLAPLAQRMGAEGFLCTQQETDANGILTGEVLPPQTIGAGKAAAITAFLTARGGDPQTCFAYGDDLSDGAMLAVVGHPVAVIGAPALAVLARKQGWETIKTAEPRPAFAGESAKI